MRVPTGVAPLVYSQSDAMWQIVAYPFRPSDQSN